MNLDFKQKLPTITENHLSKSLPKPATNVDGLPSRAYGQGIAYKSAYTPEVQSTPVIGQRGFSPSLPKGWGGKNIERVPNSSM